MENAVLDATLEELSIHGLDGLSVARVAEAAEVNKTSIYRRWPTKEDLIAAALGRAFGEAAQSMPDTGSLAGDLETALRHLEGQLSTPSGRALALVSMSVESAAAVSRICAAQQDLTRNAALRLIERASKRGEWDTDRTPAPDAVFAMMAGALMHRVLLEKQPVTPEWAKTVITVITRGLRREDGDGTTK
ncbi:MAG: TetR/AcrR family transcriptional regulator [Bacteroidota bacterium]